MTVSADMMKDAPAWATRYETMDDESGGWFVRDLTKPTTVTTATGELKGCAQLVLEGERAYVVDDVTMQHWSNPGQMRVLAAHLLNASDAWAKLRAEAMFADLAEKMTRYMTAAAVDVAGLADRTEIPAERIEGILAQTVEIGTVELILIATALDVQPSDLMTIADVI